MSFSSSFLTSKSSFLRHLLFFLFVSSSLSTKRKKKREESIWVSTNNNFERKKGKEWEMESIREDIQTTSIHPWRENCVYFFFLSFLAYLLSPHCDLLFLEVATQKNNRMRRKKERKRSKKRLRSPFLVKKTERVTDSILTDTKNVVRGEIGDGMKK